MGSPAPHRQRHLSSCPRIAGLEGSPRAPLLAQPLGPVGVGLGLGAARDNLLHLGGLQQGGDRSNLDLQILSKDGVGLENFALDGLAPGGDDLVKRSDGDDVGRRPGSLRIHERAGQEAEKRRGQ